MYSQTKAKYKEEDENGTGSKEMNSSIFKSIIKNDHLLQLVL